MNFERNEFTKHINYRKPLKNTYDKLTKDKEINIVYFGGSITHGFGSSNADEKSWRALSAKWFKDNFPEAQVNDVNTAIGESGSYLAVYRMDRDVFSQSPDLLFLEFAINDYFHGSPKDVAAMQFETIVREAKQKFPKCDIVTILTDCRETANMKELYDQAQAHEEISRAYGISTVYVGKSLIDTFGEDCNAEWSKYAIDNAHPNDLGYEKYYNCVEEFLHNSLKCTDFESTEPSCDTLPDIQCAELLDGDRKYFVCDESFAKNSSGFMYTDDCFKKLPKTPYIGYIYAENDDAEVSFEFYGTEFGMFSNFKSESKIKYSVDDGEYIETRCAVHNPTPIARGIEPGMHKVKIKPVFCEKSPATMKIVAIFTRDESKASRK